MKGKMERRQADVVQPSLENVLYCRETIESLLTPQSAPQQSTWCAGGSLCQQSVANTQKKYEESWTQTDDIMETLSSESKRTTDKKNDGVVLTKDNGRTSAGKLCPTRGGDSSSIVCLQKRISELENTNIYQSLIIRILRQLWWNIGHRYIFMFIVYSKDVISYRTKLWGMGYYGVGLGLWIPGVVTSL